MRAKGFVQREVRLFFTALMFYTRIPCPAWVGYSEHALNQSTRYFPVVGWMVGAVCAVVFGLASMVWPGAGGVAAGLALGTGILLTGGFHEDGLADVCDGFGGGWTPDRVLDIMKDSRVGAFGVLGVVLVLGLKWHTLAGFNPVVGMAVLVVGHSVSRAFAATFIWLLPYARADESSKVKPIAKQLPTEQWLLIVLLGGLPLSLFLGQWSFGQAAIGLAALLTGLSLLFGWLAWLYTTRIGGYTGDCLGAAQQLGELLTQATFLSVVAHNPALSA